MEEVCTDNYLCTVFYFDCSAGKYAFIIFISELGNYQHHVRNIGGSGDVYFMGKANYFPHVYVLSSIWQHTGWNSIMYLAALSSVDPTLHEAAEIDGANRFKRVLHVDLPCIVPTIIIMLILKSGTIMSVGYEKAFLMQNNLNMATSEIISTYAYKIGLEQKAYSLSAAISLFNNIINFSILTFVNKMSKKVSDTSLW